MSITKNSGDHTKVIVGLSGGVDSSVSALLLKQQGYNVEAVFMKNWEEDDTEQYCSASADIADAQAVCEKLAIPLHTVNFAAEYWDRVFEHFLEEYRAGRTPNPDILCNREIKFKAFLDYATQLGGDYIATGHYACKQSHEQQWQLLKAHDNNKDQTYFLYTLGQKQLARSLFPVGQLTKPHVREIAKKAGFITHDKKDSTGICFIGERKFKQFLETYLPAQPGIIETLTGKPIGEHQGLMYYTIGQRQGLGIGGQADSDTTSPWYVVKKELETNKLIVTQGHDHPALFKTDLYGKELHWITEHSPTTPLMCKAKIRYRQVEQPCQLIPLPQQRFYVVFERPQRAITPGQVIVFYDQEQCLGGGVIDDCA